MSEDLPIQKCCSKCGETKPIELFYKDKSKKQGYKNHCKACQAQYCIENADKIRIQHAAYRAANAEVVRERMRAWCARNTEALRKTKRAWVAANAESIRERDRARYAANAESIRERNRAWRAANAESIRERDRAYRAKHGEAIRQTKRAWCAANIVTIREKKRAWYAANNELILEKVRAWRAANAEAFHAYMRAHRLANPDLYRAKTQRRRARLSGNGGTFAPEELTAMRKAQNGICSYCKGQHDPDRLTIDHVIPLEQGGPHQASNIVLACRVCNSSKNNRTPEQWTNRWYERRSRASLKKQISSDDE